MITEISDEQLKEFLDNASEHTWAGGGEKIESEEGVEYTYSKDDLAYKDEYVGYIRSWGRELVRYKGNPIWNTLYGGGMEEEYEEMAEETFGFLKKALLEKTKIWSARGSDVFEDGDWKYMYEQEGDVSNFHGYEQIFYKDKLVFTHRVIGGRVVGK